MADTETASTTPQWRMHVILQQWINNQAVDVGYVDGPTEWFVTAAEAAAAARDGEALDALVDPDDARVPTAVRDHRGPFHASLECTGCGDEFGYVDAEHWSVLNHAACAPDAGDGPAPQRSEWPRLWREALDSSSLQDAAKLAASRTRSDNATSETRPFTIEVRFDTDAVDDAHARQIADLLAGAAGGQVSAVFDESWDEI